MKSFQWVADLFLHFLSDVGDEMILSKVHTPLGLDFLFCVCYMVSKMSRTFHVHNVEPSNRKIYAT